MWLNKFFLIAFIKALWVSENFLHLILISSSYFAWSSLEFPFVKNLEKKWGESSIKTKKKRNRCIIFVPYHGVPYPWYDVLILTRS